MFTNIFIYLTKIYTTALNLASIQILRRPPTQNAVNHFIITANVLPILPDDRQAAHQPPRSDRRHHHRFLLQPQPADQLPGLLPAIGRQRARGRRHNGCRRPESARNYMRTVPGRAADSARFPGTLPAIGEGAAGALSSEHKVGGDCDGDGCGGGGRVPAGRGC